MADPRLVPPNKRKDPLSPLMQAKQAANQGDVVNFCPFGCDDGMLDDTGYCHHLVGFTEDGRTMEPRVRRKEDGRIITTGKKVPLNRGDIKVKVTTCARVYRRDGMADLVVQRTEEVEQVDNRELELQARLAELRNPQLDGVYDHSPYDESMNDDELEAATRPSGK